MNTEKPFTFEISLSVLNHLGRNLYRNFVTVLGEAISNSWDADANKVEIYFDKNKNYFVIKDEGYGMTSEDFQQKFLKIGYSKRKEGKKSKKGRPYIGRKGIGKLALLSCANRMHIISKTENGQYTGGVIDNSGLDDAIKEDLKPSDYDLGKVNLSKFEEYSNNHQKGTIIYFEGFKRGIKNSEKFLRKVVALSFKFSLLDDAFKIFINGKEVTLNDLDDLAKNTQFLWVLNETNDPYVKEKLTNLRKPEKKIEIIKDEGITGFVASVRKPDDLKIRSTEEKVGIDLFVNGRVRETDILKRIPTVKLAGNYLYGQIHFNRLDDKEDRFTSSRESIVPDDKKFGNFLKKLKEKILNIINDWDKWRMEIREEGDAENKRISREKRTSIGLYNAVSQGYTISKDESDPNKNKIDGWVDDLREDSAFNLRSYTDCFISENLIRKHIQDKNLELTKDAKDQVNDWKKKERENRNVGNVNIDIRKIPNDASYLSMDGLANLVDKSQDPNYEPGLSRDAKEYKPIRDALMHTALLTDEAKDKLATIKNNIKGRVKGLLSEKEG